MKKATLFVFIIVSHLISAQETYNSFSCKTGYGYFTDLFGVFEKNLGAKPGSEPGQTGNMFWGEVQMRLNEKFSIGLMFGRGEVGFTHYPFADEPSRVFREKDIYQILGLSFYRNLDIRKARVQIGVGPQYMRIHSPQLIFGRGMIDSEEGVMEVYTDVAIMNSLDEMIGLALDVDISYPIYKNLNAGVKFNTSFMLDYGIEGLLLSPFVRIGF